MSTSDKGTVLEIPALGRNASLGFLYDERSDQFQDVFVFKGPIVEPPGALGTRESEHASENDTQEIQNKTTTSIGHPATSPPYPVGVVVTLSTLYSNIRSGLASTYEEKFKLLDVSASLKANILSGMLKVEGSAGYINNTNRTSNEVTGLMTLECHTIDEKLQIYYKSLKGFYNTDLLENTRATHILTGIKYGANVSIEFKDTANESKDQETIKGQLKIEFDKLKGAGISIEVAAAVEIDGKTISNKLNYSISVRGDINIPNLPTTHEEVRSLLTEVPKLIQQQTPGGRGVPVAFTLTPLPPLRKHLEQTTKENQLVHKLDDALLSSFVGIFDLILRTEQTLNEINDKILDHPMCVSREMNTLIAEVRGNFLREKTKFTTSLKETMIAVRFGTMTDSDLSKVVTQYTDNEYSPFKISTKIDQFDSTIKKIDFYRTSQNSYKDIEYFGHRGSLESRLLARTKDVVYLLFTKPEFTANDYEQWEECKQIFFQILYKPFNRLFIVDCDFDFPRAGNFHKTILEQIVHGRTTIKDVNEELKKSQSADPIHLKAIGRFAQMGQIYDARTDEFLEDQFLKADYPKSLLQITPHDINETNIIPSESYKDKFGVLGVQAESQFSILAGMNKLSRSGIYLANSIESSPANGKQRQSQSILHTRRLNEVEIKVKDPNFWTALEIDAVNMEATHFVTRIEYGFNTVFSVQDNYSPGTSTINDGLKQYVQNLKQILSGIQLQTRPHSANGGKSANKESHEIQMSELDSLQGNFQITVFSDIQGKRSNPDVLDNTSELLKYLNNKFIPRLSTTADTKDKMGVPIAYKLYPLANLAREIGVLKPYTPYGTMSGAEPSSFIKILHEIQMANDQIETFETDMKQSLEFITDTDLAMLKKIREKFNSTLKKYRGELRQVVKEIKSGGGKKNVEDYDRVLERYEEEGFFQGDENYVELAPMKVVGEKMHFLKKIKEKGIGILGREPTTVTLEQLLLEHSSDGDGKPIYLLYYTPGWVREFAEQWKETRAYFLSTLWLTEKENGAKFFVVNSEFEHLASEDIPRPMIHKYIHGRLISVDVKNSHEKEKEESAARETLAQITQIVDTKLTQFSEARKQEMDSLKNDLAKEMNDLKTGLTAKLNALEVKANRAPEKPAAPEWVVSQTDIPTNAVEGGTDNRGVKWYIIRSRLVNGDLIPGKLHVETWKAYSGFNGTEQWSTFKFLTAQPGSYTWAQCRAAGTRKGANIPSNAIPGGQTENGSTLYIGRCNADGALTPGVVAGGYCYYHTTSGKKSTDFEVLVQKYVTSIFLRLC